MWPHCVATQTSVLHQRNAHLVHYNSYGALANPREGQYSGQFVLPALSNTRAHHASQSAPEGVLHHRRILARRRGRAVPSDGISGTRQQCDVSPTKTQSLPERIHFVAAEDRI